MLLTDINYINDELLVTSERVDRSLENGFSYQSAVYRLNDSFQIIDSCIIRNIYFENIRSINIRVNDLILNGGTSVYLHYGETFEKDDNLPKRALCDTLYRFEKNHLIPELKLNFKDGRQSKFIRVMNIYRSRRYIFSYYDFGNIRPVIFYYFCYDTKTGKGYNMKDGYTDDINNIEKPVRICPLITNTEMFYYLHTHMKPDDDVEPNPTLYIGRLKK